ncbi:MAG TPA: MFS transporter [Lachnospiraceae bacterium]|jgi:MFS family permease|nr:MFS transporter [Lachnospiraceae bacterium]HCA69798.1 MFS transporter [Lachnospiraceae bacterium]HCM12820.1 MFS transporter [Lachnospiraceae bacterium]
MKKKETNYLLFWFGQVVSQLGSAMTGHALTIWAFGQTGSAMTVSLMAFCSYLPYVLVSIFAGSFVDKHSKKAILILSDTIAALGTASIFFSIHMDLMSIGQIYIINIIVGFMNAFQSPASSIVTGLLVPNRNYEKASGLNSFSSNLVTVSSPVLAGMIMAFGGLRTVLFIDFITFFFAMGTVFFVTIPEPVRLDHNGIKNPFDGLQEGRAFLQQNKGILYIMLSMALINFFSRLTYENILTPMILSRSDGNSTVYGIVNGTLGIGGIIGGILVTVGRRKKDPLKMIYFSTSLSFLLGDLLMGIGRNLPAWCIAGLAASIPVPFIMAGQSIILYQTVSVHMQGRIFSIRNAIQFSTIPVGILLGGYLADYVFEPFMASDHAAAIMLQKIVGNSSGSGMAVMFLCTGTLGAIFSCLAYRNKHIRSLKA